MPGAINPMRRLVTRRSWTEGYGIRQIAWTALAALCIIGSLIVLTLLADLLITRGQFTSEGLHAAQSAGLVPDDIRLDAGLWVQVARYGHLSAWSWLRPLCEWFPVLGTPHGALLLVILTGFVTVLLFLVAHVQARVNSARSARHVTAWLRNSIHRQTLRLGPSDLTGQRYQTALSLFTDEAEAIREALTEWRWRIVRAWCYLPVLAVSILAIDWRLGLQCLIPAAACWWFYRYERSRGAAQRQLAEAHAETELRFVAEELKQTRLVRGYNMEEFERSLFEKHLQRLTDETSGGRRLERISLVTARLLVRAGFALVLLLIALRVISVVHPLPLASGITLATALLWLVREASSAERVATNRSKLETGGDRIYRYLDEIPEVGQAVGAKFIEPVSKSIVLEAVHYQQQGHEILRGVDLRIEAGTQVALVSLDPLLPKAVAYLLPRFIEPTKGRVLFDGEDIAWGTLESIRTETIYVGRDDPVLSGTVLENLICGESRYSPEDAVEAAKLVHAHKFITQLPQGYETVLGEHGEQLEVGQAFRLGLARAILRDPAVLIIDEPQVILDEDTRAWIDDAYQRMSAKRTLIFLPGRLSTIRRCDTVVILHDGKVEGIAPHSDLRKSSELYRHWDYINFNSFSRQSRRLQQT
jgi:ATP-binding cassette, subfamily B, bacterial